MIKKKYIKMIRKEKQSKSWWKWKKCKKKKKALLAKEKIFEGREIIFEGREIGRNQRRKENCKAHTHTCRIKSFMWYLFVIIVGGGGVPEKSLAVT